MIDQAALEESQVVRPMSFRVGLYEAIRRTAEAQLSAVISDDLEHFYELLEERERLLEKTEAVKQKLDGEDRDRANDVVREILRIDQETEVILMDRISEARTELNTIAVGGRALKAYGFATEPRAADWR